MPTPPICRGSRPTWPVRRRGGSCTAARVSRPPASRRRGVGIALDSINAEWDWDPASGHCARWRSRPREDGAGGRVSTNNVVVLVVEYLSGISGSPDAHTLGTGEAFVFTGGNYIHGTWTRNDRLQPFTLTADDGTPIDSHPDGRSSNCRAAPSTIPFPA